MNATYFDSLEYYTQLKNAGFTEDQAQIQATALNQVIENKLATKHDIHKLDVRMDHLESGMGRLENNLEGRFKEFEERITYKLTVRCGSMMAASITLLAVIIKIC